MYQDGAVTVYKRAFDYAKLNGKLCQLSGTSTWHYPDGRKETFGPYHISVTDSFGTGLIVATCSSLHFLVDFAQRNSIPVEQGVLNV